MIEETTLASAPVSGLVGRRSLNEWAGTNVSDISGNGWHGINAQANGWVSAVLGSGLKSVAGAPQVSVPHHSSLTAGNVMTVAFWMRKNAEGISRLVGKGSSSTVENYGVWSDTADGKLRFKFYSGSGAQSVAGTTSLAQNQWYHVAVELNVTAAAGSVKFFINGVLESTQIVNGLPVTSSDPLTIGFAGYGSGFSGDMDDVCLYNRLLTDSEISGLANRTGTGVTCRYTMGTQLISQERRPDGSSSAWTVSYYGHDGLGSTRALYNASGAATDTYNYTAFGKMLKALPETGTPTVNYYLFAGEQWDPDLKLYYNRARYLNVDSGRFISRDTFEGGAGDTANLHRYLYVGCDPVNETDPSGKMTWEQFLGYEAEEAIQAEYLAMHPTEAPYISFGTRQYFTKRGLVNFLKPDIFVSTPGNMRYLEIKPISQSGVTSGVAKMIINAGAFTPAGYKPDVAWQPLSPVLETPSGERIFVVNVGGIVFYQDVELLNWKLITVGSVATARGLLPYLRFQGQLVLRPAMARIIGLAAGSRTADTTRFDQELGIAGILALGGAF